MRCASAVSKVRNEISTGINVDEAVFPGGKDDLIIPGIEQARFHRAKYFYPIPRMIFDRVDALDDLFPLFVLSAQFKIVVLPKPGPGRPSPNLGVFRETIGC